MKNYKPRTKKQAEAFTRYHVLGRLSSMRSSIYQIQRFYGESTYLKEADILIKDFEANIKTNFRRPKKYACNYETE